MQNNIFFFKSSFVHLTMLICWMHVSDWSVSCIYLCMRAWVTSHTMDHEITVKYLWERQKKKPFRVCECTLVFIHEQAHTIHTRSNRMHTHHNALYVNRWRNGRYSRPRDDSWKETFGYWAWKRHYCTTHTTTTWYLNFTSKSWYRTVTKKKKSWVSWDQWWGWARIHRGGNMKPTSAVLIREKLAILILPMYADCNQRIWTNSNC